MAALRTIFFPVAIGLMFWPTLALAIQAPEAAPLIHIGLPLPYYARCGWGSGMPRDLFIVPAILNFALYVLVLGFAWRAFLPKVVKLGRGFRVAIVTVAWIFAIFTITYAALPWMIGEGHVYWWYNEGGSVSRDATVVAAYIWPFTNPPW